jgi:hypothetical protein
MSAMVLRPVLSMLTALILAGATPATQSSGTSADTLSPDLFASVSDERYRQVMHIGPGTTPGSIRVLTRNDDQEFDASGKRVRITPFPDELLLPFPARFSANGPQRIVGVKSGFFSSWVDVLDDSAKRVAKLRGWKYGMVEIEDVLGDVSKEVLVRYNDGVAVLNEAGLRLAFIRSPRYLYQFRTIQLADSPKRAIAMWMWIDNKRGVDISVLRGDGSRVAAWHEDESERLNVFSLGGDEGEGLWSAIPGRFVERTITGTIRRTFNVPDMMRFRYMYGSALGGGRKLLVGSMGTVGSLVCVYDATGALIGRSTLPVLTWAVYVPDPNGHIFYVGNGENVLRYDASSLGRPAAAP